MQGGNRRVEQGRAGNLHKVDGGEAAGMPKEAKPPSSSPAEHHEGKRAGAACICACCIPQRLHSTCCNVRLGHGKGVWLGLAAVNTVHRDLYQRCLKSMLICSLSHNALCYVHWDWWHSACAAQCAVWCSINMYAANVAASEQETHVSLPHPHDIAAHGSTVRFLQAHSL